MIQIDCDKSQVSDGYHTFTELYNHRHALFLALMRALHGKAWISMKHDDGTMFDDMFIAGIELPDGDVVTYHLPISRWEFAVAAGAKQLDNAPKWDGHTSKDVLFRLNAFTAHHD